MEGRENKSRTPVVKLRSVIKNGKSYYILLPREFINLHRIKKGDRLPVLAGNILKIVPMNEE